MANNNKSKTTKTNNGKNVDHTMAKKEVNELIDQSERKEYRVRKDLDPNMIIPVRNGFQGKLVYVSSRTKERFTWEEFGDEQDMELHELRNAKSSAKIFFQNNWFLIDDPEVIDYLGVSEYYKNALSYDDFDEIFNMKPDDIRKTIQLLSDGQKKSVAYRAKQLIDSREIDSIKVIDALEGGLGVELIER